MVMPPGQSPVILSPTQQANAVGIIAAVRARGWAPTAAVIAVETALAESGMRMLASANVPASQAYPHEQLGYDHASCGMFQQQTGYAWTPAGFGYAMNQTTMDSPDGWGKPAVLMDAQASTAMFLNALAGLDWAQMANWDAAQAVQRSNFPDGSNYRRQDQAAREIVAALWPAPQPKSDLEDFMIVIAAPHRGIAQVVPGGKYRLSISEWDAVQGIRKACPDSVAYALIADAKWDALTDKRGRL